MTQQAAASANATVAPVSNRELDIAFSGPAMFANKFYLTGVGPNVRISFCEQLAGREPAFRTAVILTEEDIFKLRDLINRVAALKQAQAAQPSVPSNAS